MAKSLQLTFTIGKNVALSAITEVMLIAQARFQVNLVVRRDPSFPPLANLNNTVTVIPLFWAQEGYNELPASVLQKLALALMLPNLFADGIIIFCVVIGVLLILWPILKGMAISVVELKFVFSP